MSDDENVLQRVAAAIEHYGMFVPGQRVGVAVSGGADSICLLEVLVALDLKLTVLHVNHQLRGAESDGDEQFVRETSIRHKLTCECRRVDVGRLARDAGDNLEQAARRVRREFFLDFMRKGAADRVALGHTRSDQAETVLFRFLRGSGTAGLAGIRPVTHEGFVRPLIDVTRDDVECFLRERNISWRDDASNTDRCFARNRIRLDLLPALTRDWNPALTEILAGTAKVAQDEEDYWAEEISRLVRGNLVEQPPALLLRADWLRSLPRPVQRRVIRRAIETSKGDLRGVDVRHVEAILRVTDALEGSGRVQIPGVDILRSFDQIRLTPPGTYGLESREYELVVPVPGEVTLPPGHGILSFELMDKAQCSYNGDVTELDWGRISGALCVRNWRPGDQYRPVGRSHETKIKALFQEARIPLWERRCWPVLTHQDSIVWTAVFGPAVEYAAGAGTRRILKVSKRGDSEL